MKFFLALMTVPLLFTAYSESHRILLMKKRQKTMHLMKHRVMKYRTITIGSSYEYMTELLGESSGKDSIVDGVYYHYDHIGFNFPKPVKDAKSPDELKIDGIIIFPENFHKQDAVNTFGWPTENQTSELCMLYDSDTDNGFYVMLNYDQDDRITEIILHNKNFPDSEDD